MKALRIFLLILIIIGIGLLLTQKLWVPKLVNKIISGEVAPVVVPVVQNNLSLQDGRQCYTYNHEAEATAPYTVNEFIDITIKGTAVTGTKKGTQSGPDMTNGYTGTLTGTASKKTIDAVFSYVVEGSKNKEQEMYRTSLTGIEKLRYPLIEGKGMLIPDTTKEFTPMLYARVGCTGSN